MKRDRRAVHRAWRTPVHTESPDLASGHIFPDLWSSDTSAVTVEIANVVIGPRICCIAHRAVCLARDRV